MRRLLRWISHIFSPRPKPPVVVGRTVVCGVTNCPDRAHVLIAIGDDALLKMRQDAQEREAAKGNHH